MMQELEALACTIADYAFERGLDHNKTISLIIARLVVHGCSAPIAYSIAHRVAL